MKHLIIPIVLLAMACQQAAPKQEQTQEQALPPGSFGADVAFLRSNLKNVVVLQRKSDSSRVVVTGDYQARVMTSAASGDTGQSFGWLNYDLISSGKLAPHINAFGGEERFWLGPEGGQYALFFAPGKKFTFEDWQTPGLIDTMHYTMMQQSDTSVTYQQSGSIVNNSGTLFQMNITRTIRLLDQGTAASLLGVALPEGLRCVAYETDNKVTNTGDTAWQKERGLVSIWLLGMFKPSDRTAIVAPFHPLPGARKYITDDYFGKIPEARLTVKDSLLLFRGDGRSRGKLGLSPLIAKRGAGSIDLQNNSLTVLLYEVNAQGDYVNSKWEQQKEPFKGDAVNCYNDGPLADGGQMGPFYEVESSSDARALKPGESIQYRQQTMHFEGSREALQALAAKLWGLSLEEVQSFLDKK